MLSARRIGRVTPLLLALLTGTAVARADRGELPQVSQHYALTATLDPQAKRISGHVRITFTNTSARALDALVLHLYLNAFRDERSVFMRESGGRLRGERAHGRGSLELASLTIGGRDVLAASDRELVEGDRTQLRAPVDPPLRPGATLVVESTFDARLPPVFARSGYAGDFFAIAQWFPKLAKLEPDGHFASFPYHALGEFYADFADYALTLRTPGDFAAVASGVLVGERREGDQIVREFAALFASTPDPPP